MYRSRLVFALAMAALAAVLVPSTLTAQITFQRTYGGGVAADRSLASGVRNALADELWNSTALPSDSMVLHPESSLNSTGTWEVVYQGQGQNRYEIYSGRLIYYNEGGSTTCLGFSRFDVSSLPIGRIILSASIRYFQTEGPPGPTSVYCNNMDPHSALPRELFSGARATTPMESLPDTGWVTREMDSVGRNTILRGKLNSRVFTTFIKPYYRAGEGLAQGYNSPNPPALAVAFSAPLSHEAATLSILSPASSVGTDETITPLAVIANFGTEAVEVPVRMRVASTSYVSDTSASIAAGAIETLGFRPWHPLGPGTFYLRCSTRLADDSVPEDDAVSSTTIAVVAHDVGVVRIESPAAYVDSGDTVKPYALVRNHGIRADTCVAVMTIGSFYSDTGSVPLPPRQNSTVYFADWIPDHVGTWVVKCTTITKGDENHLNDRILDTVQVPASAVEEQDITQTAIVCVYPNPADTYVEVEADVNLAGPFRVQIFDHAGRLRDCACRGSDLGSVPRIRLDVRGLEPGVYFLRTTPCRQILRLVVIR